MLRAGVRVQEATDKIPAGSLPQSLDVIVRDEMVDDALRQLKSAGGALDGVEDIVTPRDAKDALTAKKMRQRPRLYEALAESIAPTVFEHKDIKHDMLLQLVGGVAKQTQANPRYAVKRTHRPDCARQSRRHVDPLTRWRLVLLNQPMN